jgi:hypothetical protein
MSVPVNLKQLTSLHETWYEYHMIGGHCDIVESILNYFQVKMGDDVWPL